MTSTESLTRWRLAEPIALTMPATDSLGGRAITSGHRSFSFNSSAGDSPTLYSF